MSDLEIDGQVLAPDQPVVMATTSHRMQGGSRFPRPPFPHLVQTGETVPFALRSLVSDEPSGSVAPVAFSLLPLPDALTVFESGPGAARHRSQIAHLSPREIGLGDNGFLRFVLQLGGP